LPGRRRGVALLAPPRPPQGHPPTQETDDQKTGVEIRAQAAGTIGPGQIANSTRAGEGRSGIVRQRYEEGAVIVRLSTRERRGTATGPPRALSTRPRWFSCADPGKRKLSVAASDHHRSQGGRAAKKDRRRAAWPAGCRAAGRHLGGMGFLRPTFNGGQRKRKAPAAMPGLSSCAPRYGHHLLREVKRKKASGL